MVEKISFLEAATALEHLCDTIDNLEKLDIAVLEDFQMAKDNLEDAINRRIGLLEYAESQINMAKNTISKWQVRCSKFERITALIKASTMETIKANPGIPYKAERGSFKIVRNSVPSLIIEENAFIPEEYLAVVTAPNKSLIRDALKAGKELTGMHLEYGEHLRIGIGK